MPTRAPPKTHAKTIDATAMGLMLILWRIGGRGRSTPLGRQVPPLPAPPGLTPDDLDVGRWIAGASTARGGGADRDVLELEAVEEGASVFLHGFPVAQRSSASAASAPSVP